MILVKGRCIDMKCAYCNKELHGEVVSMMGLFYCNFNHARHHLINRDGYLNKRAYQIVGEAAEEINIDELEEEGMNGLNIGDNCFIHGCIAEIVGSTRDCFNILIKGVYSMHKPSNKGAKELRELVDMRFDRLSVNELTGYREVKQFNPVTAYSVPKKECERIITEVFDLGAHVTSTLSSGRGNLIGIIESFELHTNRATCMSDKIGAYKDDRVRYAYKVNEIKLYVEPKKIHFNIGQMYLVNEEPMQVIQTSTSCLGLIDSAYVVRHCNVPKETTDEHLLETFDIKSIEYMPMQNEEQIAFAIIF